jgi:hypothetical protein
MSLIRCKSFCERQKQQTYVYNVGVIAEFFTIHTMKNNPKSTRSVNEQQFIYHLYASTQRDPRFPAEARLVKTFAQYDRANDKAWGYFTKRLLRLPKCTGLIIDEEYAEETGGRCVSFSSMLTTGEQKIVSVWTVEEVLH